MVFWEGMMGVAGTHSFHSSSKWKLLPGNKRAEVLGAAKDDGEFWMSYEDFCKNFTDFEMCSVSIDHLYEDEAGMCSVV